MTVASPNEVGNLSYNVQDPIVNLSWTAPSISTNGYAIKGYKIKYADDFNTPYIGATELAIVQTTSYSVKTSWLGTDRYWVVPVDIIDNEPVVLTAASYEDITIYSPATPVDFIATFSLDSIVLSWTPGTVPANSLNVQLYEIKYGSSDYEAATFLATTKTTSYTIPVSWQGSRTFLIKAIDSNGNKSTSAAQVVATPTLAGTPNVSHTVSGRDVVLSWNAVAGSLNTSYYALRQGTISDTWDTAADLASINSTSYTLRANWNGGKHFFVRAIATNGEAGAVGDEEVVVVPPIEPTISQQVVDNNVLLRWNDTQQTLPIEYYIIKRSTANGTYSGATEIGTKQGQFTVVFETQSGTYRYWVAGVDSASNVGTPGSVIATVSQPPDYVLLLNQNSTFNGTKTNTYAASGIGLIATVATGETWQTHFTNNSVTTLSGFISGGYSHYLMPVPASGAYSEEFDYGSVIGSSKVTATLSTTTISGTVGISNDISVRATSSGAWTVYSGVNEVYATNFRYVKLDYRFVASGNNDLLVVNNLNLRLDSKLKTDAGSGTASATDASGTTVNFGTSFIDVQSITVTAAGTTSPLIPVYNFVDTPYPSGFKVLLFTPSGARANGDFSWTARGV